MLFLKIKLICVKNWILKKKKGKKKKKWTIDEKVREPEKKNNQ